MGTRTEPERPVMDLGELADAIAGYIDRGRGIWRWWRIRHVVSWYLARFSPLPIERFGVLLGWRTHTIRRDVAAVDDYLAVQHPRLFASLEAWLREIYLRRN